MNLADIDTTFDFTTDTPGFWDDFWERKDGIGYSGKDPDWHSPMLRSYHRLLWSKKLPCGKTMRLENDPGGYLSWEGTRYSSDSITTGFRYLRNRPLLKSVADTMPDYRGYVENYVHKTYTVGGSIIFPRHPNSMNQRRGVNGLICDRWDLTLECIRRHYAGEESPLSKTISQDSEFFDLFVDFEGYIDFFYLQDCIDPVTDEVVFWLGDGSLRGNPMPRTVAEYLSWIESQAEFVKKRNERIQCAIRETAGIKRQGV